MLIYGILLWNLFFPYNHPELYFDNSFLKSKWSTTSSELPWEERWTILVLLVLLMTKKKEFYYRFCLSSEIFWKFILIFILNKRMKYTGGNLQDKEKIINKKIDANKITSCRTASTDFLELLLPPISIVHCSGGLQGCILYQHRAVVYRF